METKTWHFVDRYTGEEFFVESVWSYGACETAKKYFDFPVCQGIVEPEVAEAAEEPEVTEQSEHLN